MSSPLTLLVEVFKVFHLILGRQLHPQFRVMRRSTGFFFKKSAEVAAKIRKTPPPSGERPAALLEPRPQGQVQRHTVEHIIDVVPFVQILDVPVPQVGWRLDTLTPKQVIEVPKISQDSTPQRCGLATYADSWWKCRLSCLIPLCSSRLPSRTWTLQFLALVVIMGRGCTSPHPWSQERDVTEILDHTTKRDDQPVKELFHGFNEDTHALACPDPSWPRSCGGRETLGDGG